MSSKMLGCEGTIFHFDSDCVLFKFTGPNGDETIGVIKSTNIRLKNGTKITKADCSNLAGLLKAGDVLKATVFRKAGLDKVLCSGEKDVEDTSNIEIQPEWVAYVADLVSSSRNDQQSLSSTTKPIMKTAVASAGRKSTFIENDYPFLHVTLKDLAKLDSRGSSDKDEKNGEEFYFDSAVLTQVQKPFEGYKASKVLMAFFTMTSGQFNKKIVSVSNNCMYAWGHSLSKANLMLNLKPGDKCSVKYSIERPTDAAPCPLVKALWFGSQKSTPTNPSDPGFSNWLKSKNLAGKEFMDWIENQVPPKPYFPYSTNIYSCKIIGFLREEGNFSAQGVYLEFFRITANAADARTIGLLMREDFYVCGSAVGDLDLRFLLHRGDRINCQLMPISNMDKLRLQKELALPSSNDVTYIANLGYLGTERPQEAGQSLDSNRALEKWLASKGHTLEEFRAMINPTQRVLAHRDPDINIATDLATRLLSQPNPNFKTFLGNAKQVEIARKMVKLLSQAISSIDRDKPPVKNVATKPSKDHRELKSIEKVLETKKPYVQPQQQPKVSSGLSLLQNSYQPSEPKSTPKTGLTVLQHSYDFVDLTLSEQLKQVQNSLAQEVMTAQSLAAKAAAKPKPIIDGKRRLESYKASLMPKQPSVSPARETTKKEVSPLEYLRDYTVNDKNILIDKTTIWFDNVGFPKSYKTNLKNSMGIGTVYYTLETLTHFMTIYQGKQDYGEYLHMALKAGVTPIHRNDSESIWRYLSSAKEKKPPNLIDISHKELNPELFSDTATQKRGYNEKGNSSSPKRSKRSKSPRTSRFSAKSHCHPQNLTPARSSSPSKSSLEFPAPVASRRYDPGNPTESPPQTSLQRQPDPVMDAKWEQYKLNQELLQPGRQEQQLWPQENSNTFTNSNQNEPGNNWLTMVNKEAKQRQEELLIQEQQRLQLLAEAKQLQWEQQEQKRLRNLKEREDAERFKKLREEEERKENERRIQMAQEEALKQLQLEQQLELKLLLEEKQKQERKLRLQAEQEAARAREEERRKQEAARAREEERRKQEAARAREEERRKQEELLRIEKLFQEQERLKLAKQQEMEHQLLEQQEQERIRLLFKAEQERLLFEKHERERLLKEKQEVEQLAKLKAQVLEDQKKGRDLEMEIEREWRNDQQKRAEEEQERQWKLLEEQKKAQAREIEFGREQWGEPREQPRVLQRRWGEQGELNLDEHHQWELEVENRLQRRLQEEEALQRRENLFRQSRDNNFENPIFSGQLRDIAHEIPSFNNQYERPIFSDNFSATPHNNSAREFRSQQQSSFDNQEIVWPSNADTDLRDRLMSRRGQF